MIPRVYGGSPPAELIFEELPSMKLAIRILALSVVVAGGVAAAVTPKGASAIKSHQAVTATMPTPGCVPGLPTCPANPNSTN
jgi:hypothetical protein